MNILFFFFLQLSLFSVEARLWYYGFYPLVPGCTVLDASEKVDNVLFSASYSATPSVTQIINLNTVNNSTTHIGQLNGVVSDLGQSYSNSNNSYIKRGIEGEAYKIDSITNNFVSVKTWNYTGQCVKYDQKSSKSWNQIFQILVTYDNVNLVYQTQIYFTSPNTWTGSLICVIAYQCFAVTTNQNGYAYIICENATSTFVNIYDQYGAFQGSIVQNYIGTKIEIFVYNNYLSFSIDFQIFTYDGSSRSKLWSYNFTVSEFVTQITIFNAWLCTLTNTGSFSQFHVGVGKLFDTIQINQSKIKLFQNYSDVMIVAWSPGNTSISFYSITNDYTCPGDCSSCWGGYSINSSSLSCYVPTYTPTPPQPQPPPPPTPAQNGSQILQNNSLIGISGQKSWCFYIDNNSFCHEPCNTQCLICQQKVDICVLCSDFYILEQNSQCRLSLGISILSYLYSIMNTFKVAQLQNLYILINNLGLYEFHITSYNGVIETVSNL